MDNDSKRLFQYAGRILARKSYTRHEMRKKLTGKFPESPSVEKIIEKLEELNYLNDGQYARMFAQNRLLGRHWGPRKVVFELAGRGIPRSDAEKAVQLVLSENSQESLLENALQKWLKSHGEVRRLQDLVRLRNLLLRQGFSPELVNERCGKIALKEKDPNDEG